ncbi:MAG: YigZ family protein [Acidaminobacter sp.]|uniref:YigZ family protein n=1 Tax=Acidaminobacter sp. TaxID=1872102 RepID=UPI001383AA74|nr:YigZ family protein [Acidaminobacter sp.]MZQ96211.1 YigZ family protein [Acidaminobacter sp.]
MSSSDKSPKLLNYKTVEREASAETVIEKSRFIGYVKPVKSEEEAQAFMAVIRKKHWDATHNVPVYVLGPEYHAQKFSDDGEPQGTAGLPILSMLKNEGITDVVVLVTRYFGGVKLGTGGLVRAYTQSAQLGLAAAGVIERVIHRRVSAVVDYTLLGKVQNYLAGHPTIRVADTLYTDHVTLELLVLTEEEAAIHSAMVDLTSAQLDWVPGELEEISCPAVLRTHGHGDA